MFQDNKLHCQYTSPKWSFLIQIHDLSLYNLHLVVSIKYRWSIRIYNAFPTVIVRRRNKSSVFHPRFFFDIPLTAKLQLNVFVGCFIFYYRGKYTIQWKIIKSILFRWKASEMPEKVMLNYSRQIIKSSKTFNKCKTFSFHDKSVQCINIFLSSPANLP